MRRRVSGLMLSTAAFVIVGGAVSFTHHAFSSEFDATKPVTLRGVITKMEWINPHSWIHVEVKQPDGSVESWAVEAGAPNAMFRRGWNPASIKAGTEVVIEGFQAKDGRPIANGRSVLLADGRKLFVGSPEGGAPDEPR